MANIVITSQNRIVGLPVKVSELEPGEKIVATNAPMGMLYVVETPTGEILRDYEELENDEIPDGMPISIPLVEDYKNKTIKELKLKINQVNEL